MRFISNLKIRTALLLVLVPVVLIVGLRTIYATADSNRIDRSYRTLIESDFKTLLLLRRRGRRGLSLARIVWRILGLILRRILTGLLAGILHGVLIGLIAIRLGL